ncbi:MULTISPECIES: FGGY-family carbohydrate kinase [Rhizobium]|uniref:FGGY-family carbohydrate kinase n=1 Tax=Rhizobium rhododendri TaxID=2506430 RepID=A0ABY8IFT8_9HYPH|nr:MULTISPECIES: FGGY-family carbohydrate kinase [Rhizobium]MBZ5759213.1 FGGY-family carbohydrate kinase [Rhizobium sp. VS19-DR96]MBZ5763956.1 FGGY-family carbohydrate kinase [Rhizobium sp. VS19-DR129.2]MBZ5771500.1 FGGY-family carbohydrate kinase [Rhizobium sp. VS19-DRK62.2]MBZ5783813.1 FGGY-family carbohydrate kinase [Rhizobium sp. VS19-DR121]MBZ5801513.1 FGGY-family carbohydrate kinase [Rhizobium sp. VS19-DR181]
MRDHVIAVDIGTSSARAGVFDSHGRMLGKGEHPILMNRPQENHAEHSSEDIWSAVCAAVRAARSASGVAADAIAGIGFDATCSLVVRDRDGQPLTVSTGGEARFDTIVWLDHRALAEADLCTATQHRVIAHSGHVMSPEMQMPKLMWLKKNLPESWARSGYFFDLADFMTYKATGSLARSRCTLTAKWNYLAHRSPGWQHDFLDQIGLSDLLERGHLPEETAPVGSSMGMLGVEAAQALGLDSSCRVSAGVIDAYAGALGALAAHVGKPEELERQLALIAGTSSCVVAFSREMPGSTGMWGPYFDVVYPDWWLVEAGQSATGGLLDHIVRMHAAGGAPTAALHAQIVARILELRDIEGADFGARIHVLPDFHGNRSPLADPHAVGVISGLTLDTSFDGLCRLYWRTSLGIALGIRHILDKMREHGHVPDTLHVAGGHVKNAVLMELYADVTGCTVIMPKMNEAVLLGTAIAASVACGMHETLATAGAAMYPGGNERVPDASRKAGYDREYRRFLAMIRHRAELEMMD